MGHALRRMFPRNPSHSSCGNPSATSRVFPWTISATWFYSHVNINFAEMGFCLAGNSAVSNAPMSTSSWDSVHRAQSDIQIGRVAGGAVRRTEVPLSRETGASGRVQRAVSSTSPPLEVHGRPEGHHPQHVALHDRQHHHPSFSPLRTVFTQPRRRSRAQHASCSARVSRFARVHSVLQRFQLQAPQSSQGPQTPNPAQQLVLAPAAPAPQWAVQDPRKN